MNRRDLLAAAAPALLYAAVDRAQAQALPLGPLSGSSYPDPRIEVIDKRFKAKLGFSSMERIATGCRWCEGPVYFRDLRCLIWSDIPNNRMLRWDETNETVSVFRQPSNMSNGNTRDRQGRLISCEYRRVTRTEWDGQITVLIDHYQGKRLNAPNDVVVAADDSIWFTDPIYGISDNYEGRRGTSELPHNVYRIDGHSGAVNVVADDFVGPNGLAFSPDEKLLYIVDSGVAGGVGPSKIRVFDVDRGRLNNGRVFIDHKQSGVSDGVRLDSDGNVWCSFGWGDPSENGVRCYAPSGDLIGKIHLPETPANLCFGGALKNRLFMAAGTSVYAMYVGAEGAMTP